MENQCDFSEWSKYFANPDNVGRCLLQTANAPEWIIAVALIGSFILAWMGFLRKRHDEFKQIRIEITQRTPHKRLTYLRFAFWSTLLLIATFLAGRLFDAFWLGSGANSAMAEESLSYPLSEQWDLLASATAFPRATTWMLIGAVTLIALLLWSVLGRVSTLRTALHAMLGTVFFIAIIAGGTTSIASAIMWFGTDPPNNQAMAAFFAAWAFGWVLMATSATKLDLSGDAMQYAMLPGASRPLHG